MSHITPEQAHAIGAKGAPATEAERLLFEAWMRGHCWAVIGDWDGKQYVHPTEVKGYVNPSAQNTRQLWAVWRDRAALAQPETKGCACRWDADDNRVATCTRHQGWLDVVQEWADRAKEAESKLAQPEPVAAPKHEYVIDLPDGDIRETKVWWSEQKATGEGLSHRLSITVSETPSTVVVNADYREMCAEQVRMNQQLTAALAQPEPVSLNDDEIKAASKEHFDNPAEEIGFITGARWALAAAKGGAL